ncbi:hypothetical protein HPP92_019796 [Vanilla planifolia]|uniref:Uncharacterized protein n=1 Tax=Vanilla planifolia TaxID=51239 RepID=A0A835QAC0_VANPL|nr:hypothetical protein HPP92_019796 [Vanilla planifolia]
MNSSPFMDKQIMGLSGSPTVGIGSGGGGGEFFDLMNPQEERRDNGGVLKKEEILPSYDFQPIRPSSSLPASSGDDAARHSRFSSGPLFGETGLGPDFKRTHHHGASMDDVENTVKKHADILLHALEGMSSRLSQLESRTCILENSVDDLKASIGNLHGSSDGKLRHLENILREVQAGVQVLRDKQEIAEAHLELAKLQVSAKADHHQPEMSSHAQPEPPPQPQQPPQTLPPQHLQPPPPVAAVAPSLPALNAQPQQQNQPPVPFSSQLSMQTQLPSVPSVPREQSYQLHQQYSTPSVQPNEPPNYQPQQYQMPPSQPQPPPQHYPPATQIPNYNQPIQPEDSKSYIPPSQPYPSNLRPPPPPSQAPNGPPITQYYGANPPPLDLLLASRPSSGPNYGGPAISDSYQYGSTSLSAYNMKPPPFSAPQTSVGSVGGGGGYQRLPTAKLLPNQAPVAEEVRLETGCRLMMWWKGVNHGLL